MFAPSALATLAHDHQDTLQLLCNLEDQLNRRFYDMEGPVHCMMLAAITGEAMVMIGPPGTAKSRLVRSFCNLIGILGADALVPNVTQVTSVEAAHQSYFEYLLTQFTEPSELFGYFDMAKLFHADNPSLERDETNMMQRAEVVFLDEVFNASSAILNALLTFMNEHKFHDRGRRVQTPLRLLFSATNHAPREEGLGAVYDRFLLRSRIENVGSQPGSIASMVDRAWTETHAADLGGKEAKLGGKATERDGKAAFADLLPRLDAYRADIDQMTAKRTLQVAAEDPLFARLADIVAELRRKDLSQMSNRRLVKFSSVFLAEALLRAQREGSSKPAIEARDLSTLLAFGLDEVDPGTVNKLRQHLLEAS